MSLVLGNLKHLEHTKEFLLRLHGLTDIGCHATGPPAPNGKH